MKEENICYGPTKCAVLYLRDWWSRLAILRKLHQQSKESVHSVIPLPWWLVLQVPTWMVDKGVFFGQKTELVWLPPLGSELKTRREEEASGKGEDWAWWSSYSGSGTKHIIWGNLLNLPPLGGKILQLRTVIKGWLNGLTIHHQSTQNKPVVSV